ncbi:MAG: hypothetical protein IID61_00430 [SAR324 cluster bacterium]|nr:hypothetical protein [SAR324 cluster bacterium]
MIRQTTHHLAGKLKRLLSHDISAGRSFDLLQSRARTIEEMVVIEVMRESYCEVRQEQIGAVTHAEARSA